VSQSFMAKPDLYPWCRMDAPQPDYAACYAAMDKAEKCICEWDLGPCRTPNLRCPVHALEDAAAEAVGRILGGA
jgi:hypothetical protein